MASTPAAQSRPKSRLWRRVDWVFLVVGILVTVVAFDVLLFAVSSIHSAPPLSGDREGFERFAEWSGTNFSIAEVGGLFVGAFATGFLARHGRGLATATALGVLIAVPLAVGAPLIAPLAILIAVLMGWVGAELRGFRVAGRGA